MKYLKLFEELSKEQQELYDKKYPKVKCECGWSGREDELITKSFRNGGDEDVCPGCMRNDEIEYED